MFLVACRQPTDHFRAVTWTHGGLLVDGLRFIRCPAVVCKRVTVDLIGLMDFSSFVLGVSSGIHFPYYSKILVIRTFF